MLKLSEFPESPESPACHLKEGADCDDSQCLATLRGYVNALGYTPDGTDMKKADLAAAVVTLSGLRFIPLLNWREGS